MTRGSAAGKLAMGKQQKVQTNSDEDGLWKAKLRVWVKATPPAEKTGKHSWRSAGAGEMIVGVETGGSFIWKASPLGRKKKRSRKGQSRFAWENIKARRSPKIRNLGKRLSKKAQPVFK